MEARCADCGWPAEEARVLSTHRTSEGWIRYRKCVCGDLRFELITLDGAGPDLLQVHAVHAAGMPG